MKKIRIGTRGSALALAQAKDVERRIRSLKGNLNTEICVIRTRGDVIQDVPLSQIKGQGFFVKELEAALLRDEVDVAVHSAKDLPTNLHENMTIAAFPEREVANDCLVSRTGAGLAQLPRGASVATSALRRQALIAHQRPDLELRELRGNVDTRLKKLDDGQFDAMIVALAALRRLGKEQRATEVLPLDLFVPAPAQGALAIEIRRRDRELFELLQPVNHEATRSAVLCERAFLQSIQGGCQVPVGAHCTIIDGMLTLLCCIASHDGTTRIDKRGSGELHEVENLGRTMATELLDQGGQTILDQIRGDVREQ